MQYSKAKITHDKLQIKDLLESWPLVSESVKTILKCAVEINKILEHRQVKNLSTLLKPNFKVLL